MTDLWNKGFSLQSLIAGSTYGSERGAADRGPEKAIEPILGRQVARLGRFFSIEKASLAHYFEERDKLHVTHIYKDHIWHTGLTLIIQNAGSTMYQVLAQGFPVADNYPRQLSENIIERKILMSENTRSVLIIPLVHDGRKLGILTLSSTEDCAFGTYLEGVGQGIVAELTAYLDVSVFAPRTV